MNVFVFADIHYANMYKSKRSISEAKLSAMKTLGKQRPDLVLLCGDNAETTVDLRNQHALYKTLREAFNCSIAVVAGNHDLWVNSQMPRGLTQV